MASAYNTSNITSTEGGDSSLPPKTTILAILILLSCVGNISLLHASVQMRKTCYYIQSVTIINLVAVCLGDCFLNMSLVLGSLVEGSRWQFSEPLCKWHAFAMNLVLVESTLLLTVLACDRFLAIRFSSSYDSLSSPVRLGIAIALTWAQAVAFSAPYLSSVVETTFQPKLHTCILSERTPLSFICLTLVLCFLAPFVIVTSMFIATIRTTSRKHTEVSTMMDIGPYSDKLMEKPQHRHDMLSSNYVVILCALWLILEAPCITTGYILQYKSNGQTGVDYPWGLDVAFIWMRFAFSVALPCATFVCKKDMRQFCKECVTCHRSNSVLDIQREAESSRPKASQEVRPAAVLAKTKDREKLSGQPLPPQPTFSVPVLFATSEGIHIETPYHELAEWDNIGDTPGERALKGRQLDNTDHIPDQMDFVDDTSDYDSSTEAGLRSVPPLPSRYVRGEVQGRSASVFAVTDEMPRLGSRSAAANCGHFSAKQTMDSGVDLSATTQYSSTEEDVWVNCAEIAQKNSVSRNIMMTMVASSVICNDDVKDRKIGGSDQQLNTATAPKRDKSQTHNPNAHGSADASHVVAESEMTAERHRDKNQAAPQSGNPPPQLTGKLKPVAQNLNSDKHKKGRASRQHRKAVASLHSDAATEGTAHRETSQERQGKGHRKTHTTPDGEKPLLGSNSSAEMQAPKTNEPPVN